MVILFEWHHIAMDQKSRNGLPMIGEDTGLEALASPLEGYLGKVRERAASLENCPWCTSKGLTYALRSYRLNLQESITLCTNPQCLFPLVSQSLEDVLASLVLAEPVVGSKRKNASEMEKEESIKPKCKRLRSSELDSLGPQRITDTLISQAERGVGDGQHAAPKTDGEKANGDNWDSPVAETTGRDSPEDEEDVLEKASVNGGCTDDFSPTSSLSAGQLQCSPNVLTADGNEPVLSPRRDALGISEEKDDIRQVRRSPPEALSTHSGLSFFTNENFCSTEIGAPAPRHSETAVGHKSPTADVTFCKIMEGIESEDLSSTTVIEPEELLPVPDQLFWRNSENLCWLDSMLVALVKCKSLRKCQPKETWRSPVWQLIKGYEDACAAIHIHQQPDRDGVARVPNHVLQKADADLHSLRMSVFELLQPKLHCQLGQMETPVFALPLLLAMDSWVEPLFKLIFHWELRCSQCKTPTKERHMKTLPSFTNILPNWCPLNAVHLAPCNVCSKKNQRRTMMLHRVPPVFGLHFVEGLPDNDVRNYTFTFKGKRYSVTTFIQYDQQLKHFVTWICNSDGSWLEYDDLKYPECTTHQKLRVPAEEIHIVFWEVEEEDKEPLACSPSSTFAESRQSPTEMSLGPGDEDLIADELLAHTPDHSVLTPLNDTGLVCALSTSEDGGNITDTTVSADVDASIGSTTLLDTFEGLTHDDIITLTLVEISDGSDAQTVNDNPQTPGFSVPNRNEIIDSTPDSSSAIMGSEMSDAPRVELPTTSNSSESENDLSSDPTFVPGVKAGRGRSKPSGRQADKKAASFKAPVPISSSESSEPFKINASKPASAAVAQDSAPPAETTPQASPVSSTDASPLATTQSSTLLPLQNSRWSFLLSKHPLRQVGKTLDKLTPTPVTQRRPTPSPHSTHNPVKRQQIPGAGLLKPQLRTVEGEGLPPKAAEMYDSFGAKSSSTPIPDLNLKIKAKLSQPIVSNHQKLPVNTTAVSGTSLPLPRAKGPPDISSSRNRSNRFSEVPRGLSETEALRHKLMKKLKAKKKKLAKLNEMLGHQGGGGLAPDSTKLCSPYTVTSSTYDGSIGDDLLSDLLSPATTASNLSPDSTGFLEMLANGQEAVDQFGSGAGAVSQGNPCVNEPNDENFLDDFLSQAVSQRPTEMEAEALSALELFI